MSEVLLRVTDYLREHCLVFLLLDLLDLVECLPLFPGALSFPLNGLDFDRDVILLGDELVVLLPDLLHLLLVQLLLVLESLVI